MNLQLAGISIHSNQLAVWCAIPTLLGGWLSTARLPTLSQNRVLIYSGSLSLTQLEVLVHSPQMESNIPSQLPQLLDALAANSQLVHSAYQMLVDTTAEELSVMVLSWLEAKSWPYSRRQSLMLNALRHVQHSVVNLIDGHPVCWWLARLLLGLRICFRMVGLVIPMVVMEGEVEEGEEVCRTPIRLSLPWLSVQLFCSFSWLWVWSLAS